MSSIFEIKYQDISNYNFSDVIKERWKLTEQESIYLFHNQVDNKIEIIPIFPFDYVVSYKGKNFSSIKGKINIAWSTMKNIVEDIKLLKKDE